MATAAFFMMCSCPRALAQSSLRSRSLMKVPLVLVSLVLGLVAAIPARPPAPTVELWRQVEIVRTAHGVPHIRAENLRAAGYALAWVMSEDYGPRTGMRLVLA